MADEYRAKVLEEAAQECDKWLARRRQTLVEIYGDDKLGLLDRFSASEEINQAKAYGELYAYESLARAIRNLNTDATITEAFNGET